MSEKADKMAKELREYTQSNFTSQEKNKHIQLALFIIEHPDYADLIIDAFKNKVKYCYSSIEEEVYLKFAQWHSKKYGVTKLKKSKESLADMIMGELEPKWVSVEDRLPSIGRKTLLLVGVNKKGRERPPFTALASFEKTREFYIADRDFPKYGFKVTHWLDFDIPDTPEKKVK